MNKPLKQLRGTKKTANGHAELWEYRTHWLIKRFTKGEEFPKTNAGTRDYIFKTWEGIETCH